MAKKISIKRIFLLPDFLILNSPGKYYFESITAEDAKEFIKSNRKAEIVTLLHRNDLIFFLESIFKMPILCSHEVAPENIKMESDDAAIVCKLKIHFAKANEKQITFNIDHYDWALVLKD